MRRQWLVGTDTSMGAAAGRVHVLELDETGTFRTVAVARDEETATHITATPESLKACEAVLEWARTPGDHGGNPYTKEFVKLAGRAVKKAGRQP